MEGLLKQLLAWQNENEQKSFCNQLTALDIFVCEKKELEEIFLKKKPSQVLSQDLACKDYLVDGLTDTAFVYFLPRFLFLILTNAEALDVFVESVVSRLTPPKGDGSRREKWNHSIESILTIQKIRLVAKTFDWLSSVNEFSGYKKAIDEYWGRYLNT